MPFGKLGRNKMSTLDPSIFNEANASQKRAVELLRSMGYAYVPRAEADRKRRSPANVLFYDELEKFLSSRTYEYRGLSHPFSGSSVGKAVRDLDAPLSGGLMAASCAITLPIVVLALLLQQYIISGLTAGAVKS